MRVLKYFYRVLLTHFNTTKIRNVFDICKCLNSQKHNKITFLCVLKIRVERHFLSPTRQFRLFFAADVILFLSGNFTYTPKHQQVIFLFCLSHKDYMGKKVQSFYAKTIIF